MTITKSTAGAVALATVLALGACGEDDSDDENAAGVTTS